MGCFRYELSRHGVVRQRVLLPLGLLLVMAMLVTLSPFTTPQQGVVTPNKKTLTVDDVHEEEEEEEAEAPSSSTAPAASLRQAKNNDNTTTRQQKHTKPEQQPTTSTFTASSRNCSAVKPYELVDKTLKPLWVPAYPGSGSEMLRALVRATTGLGGHDVYQGRKYAGGFCKRNTATCKTHWNSVNVLPRDDYFPSERKDEFYNRYVMLLRNPAKALPSHFNHVSFPSLERIWILRTVLTIVLISDSWWRR